MTGVPVTRVNIGHRRRHSEDATQSLERCRHERGTHGEAGREVLHRAFLGPSREAAHTLTLASWSPELCSKKCLFS